MTPIIRILGFLSVSLGALFFYGVMRLYLTPPVYVETLTSFLLPLVHLLTGLGLIFGKRLSRYVFVCTAVFYMLLGVLVLKNAVSLSHFIPIASLIEWVPVSVLKFNPGILSGFFFFALPLLAVLLLSTRSVGFSLEPFLQGRFSWSVPIPVIFSAAFLFSHSLIGPSRISLFTGTYNSDFFGFTLPPMAAKGVAYGEFAVPLVLSFALIEGRMWSWFVGFLYAAYYWAPFFLSGNRTGFLNDPEFVLFGGGVVFLMLSLVYSRTFFWDPARWAEPRDGRRKNPFFIGLFLSGTIMLLAGVVWLAAGDSIRTLPHAPGNNVKQSPPAPEAVPELPKFRLEGTSVDSGEGYAIVSGEIVRAGMMIQGYRVEKIENKGVLFSKGARQYRLGDEGRFEEI